ncbi:MAG: hypothetical protein C4534_03040 [Gaiellales bacterium]|nr:MAG: hypothetical protein C4534_03040 [Gaiellales bacterium]
MSRPREAVLESPASLNADLLNRSRTDRRIGFLPAFLLSLVTLGVYGAYVLYRLLERREQHFERMVSLRRNLLAVLEERVAVAAGRTALARDMEELRELDRAATAQDRRGEKSPVLWLVLGILTGVTNFYVYYFLNSDFHAHGAAEEDFMRKAGQVLGRLGLRLDVSPPAPPPRRRFGRYLLLTLLTLGLFSIYWWYTLITDPDAHFDGHTAWEASLAGVLGGTAPLC